jgi:hypothetical protein
MRQWKMELKRKCDQFDTVYDKRETKLLPIVRDFSLKGRTGSQRAFAKLRKLLGPGVILEGVRFHPSPLAVFYLLRPRESITLDAPIDTGLMQDCVVVNYVLAGLLPPDKKPDTPQHLTMMGVAEGHWTLEVPDHAIGRCIHRTGLLPDAIIREAHLNLLRLNPRLVFLNGNRIVGESRFNVRAGPGGFVCTFRVGEEVSRKEYMARIRADTWIAEEEGGHQALLTGNGHPGHRLVDNWLMPAPLRRMSRTGDTVDLEIHDTITLPELTYRH